MKSANITATDGRVLSAFSPVINQIIDSSVDEKIKSEVDKSKIFIGVVTKFYPYLDKAEVKVDDKLILCKVLHRMHGSVIDFFTPEGDDGFCEKLKEPCVYPRGELNVAIVDILDNTHEMLLLGYYYKEDVLFSTPAKQGHYKISNIGATNRWGFDIGEGSISIRSMDGVEFTEGEFHEDNSTVEYANTDNVYTKEKVYTKEEVDELIREAIDDLREEILGDTGDTTT